TESVDDELALLDGTFAFHVGRAAFQAAYMLLLDLEFGGVFDGDDALVGRDEAGEHVEQRGLTGACTTRDDDIETGFDGALEQLHHGRRERAYAEEIFRAERRAAEAADGDERAVDRERRNDDVDARAIEQA